MRHRTTTKVFQILAGQGLAFVDLARRTGLNVRTLHNVASGSSVSRRARRKVENALGVRIWPVSPGTQPVSDVPQF